MNTKFISIAAALALSLSAGAHAQGSSEASTMQQSANPR